MIISIHELDNIGNQTILILIAWLVISLSNSTYGLITFCLVM